ncbi:carbohydrate binding family 9 domain-containing protein [candidate division KSB1 bacterium]|nr:carbohydrate binding family 9 domain-containing protein [candidate division KSB1 bacterium]
MKKIFIFLILFFTTQTLAREIKAIKTNTKITIDGFIAVEEWSPNIFQTGFIQMEPNRGQPSREITKVAIQYDDKNIYAAFICEKSYPDPIVAEQSRRDQIEKQEDLLVLILDTYHDSRSAFWFMTNGLNSQTDLRISDDGKYLDVLWDTGWDVKTNITEKGITAEFSIPFKSLRFNPKLTTWGINFARFVPKWLETSFWAGTTDLDFRVSNFGDLTGLEFPQATSEYRIIPYVTARYETFADKKWDEMYGLDLEYRYKNNITGDFTYNPDFATVEGDKERINMSRWELSFPEKRKFFREGGELFSNRIRTFYSRRIGEINFGGKVIGKTGKNTFAVIGVNAKKVENNPLTSKDEASPEYNIGVVRMKRDIMKSSTIGLIYIDKEWTGGYNRVLGLDAVLHFPYEFHFTSQFIAAAPGNFKENYGGFVRLARENNIYHYHLRYTELGENFKESVNGVGYIRDDDRRELDSAVEYKWWIKKSGIEFLDYFSNYNIYWGKNSATLRSWEIIQELEIYFKNKFSLSTELVREYELFEKGFYNYDVDLTLGYNTEEWSSAELSYLFGKNYDRAYRMIIGAKNIKFHDKLSAEYEIRKLNFDPDPEKESTWLNILTLNYQFTPDLFVRLFTQHRSATDRFYVYGLFGWRFKLPNSAIYFVYTRDDFDRPFLTRERNEIFFLKLAYDFSF